MSLRDDLKAFLDGELPQDRSAEVKAALETDESLRREAQFLRALGEEVRVLAAEPQVQGFERTVAAVSRKTRFHIFGMSGWSFAAVLGVLVVVSATLSPVMMRATSAAKRSQAESGSPAAADAAVTERYAESKSAVPSDGAGGAGAPSRQVESNGADFSLSAPAAEEAASTPSAPPVVFDKRMIVKNASLGLKVENVARAVDESIGIATSLGGIVQSSNTYRASTTGSRPSANLTLRVPARQFETALKRLSELGETTSQSITGDDVTAQHADVAARLKVMKGEEQQYLTILGQTRKIGEVLQVKERLSQVRQEIESLEAQRKALSDLASLSTINLSLEQRETVGEPEPERGWAEETWAASVNALLAAGRFLGRGIITLFVFAPIWVPILLIAWWLARRARKG